MNASELTKENLTAELIDRLLFQGIEDTGETADCIIVLGSEKAVKYRVPVAVEAYRAGRAPKILLCGGTKWSYPDGEFTEAEYMCQTALALGVPMEDMILENNSMNTVENILYAMTELQRAFYLDRVKKILLVTATYHMRRSLAIASDLFPAHIKIIPCPADDTDTRRDNWMNTPEGTERATAEALNIAEYIKKKGLSIFSGF